MKLWLMILLCCSMSLWAGEPIKAGFVVVDGVYNTELTAPLDILEHSRVLKRDRFFKVYVVSPDGKPVTTAEGLVIHADYSFENAPLPDVLVIPSTQTSMSKDFESQTYMGWVHKALKSAKAVVTLCDGAFPLAHSGALDGLNATTFPGDQEALAQRYAKVKVHRDVWFVQDSRYITSVGGARSFEPALFLVHQWMGEAAAKRLAGGLVIDWDLSKIPHKSFGNFPPMP